MIKYNHFKTHGDTMQKKCVKCGNDLKPNAEVCSACGHYSDNFISETSDNKEHKQIFWIGVFSMVGFLIPIIGIVLGVIGVKKGYQNRTLPYVKEGFILSWIGLTFSIIYFIYALLNADSLL